MPLRGVLRTWNEDRGFGFIAPAHGGAELFVHIQSFPADGTHPTVGERLAYELGRDRDGRPQAVKVHRLAAGEGAGSAKQRVKVTTRPSRRVFPVLVFVLLIAGGAFGYSRYKAYGRRLALEQIPTASPAVEVQGQAIGAPRCDGRTTCSQMTSCAEAKWFLNNCPGTRMDGNHDGVPCEQQWCTHPVAK
jgi:cold shock CspA family protein